MKRLKNIVLIYFVIFSIFITYKINSIEAQIINIDSYQNTKNTLDISTMNYYNELSITDDNYKDVINSKNYMLYFHQEKCDYCFESNVLIDKYITAGNEIYLLTPNNAYELFNNYEVESTPTLIVFENNKVVEKIVGSDNVNDYIEKQLNKK